MAGDVAVAAGDHVVLGPYGAVVRVLAQSADGVPRAPVLLQLGSIAVEQTSIRPTVQIMVLSRSLGLVQNMLFVRLQIPNGVFCQDGKSVHSFTSLQMECQDM
jgi:hypothetical protein